MTYVIVAERKAWWPVEWDEAQDGGKVRRARIEMRFILSDVDDATALQAEANLIDSEEDVRPKSEKLADWVGKIACDWKGVGVTDPDDEKKTVALPFEPENLQKLVQVPGVFVAIVDAWTNAMKGRATVRTKN